MVVVIVTKLDWDSCRWLTAPWLEPSLRPGQWITSPQLRSSHWLHVSQTFTWFIMLWMVQDWTTCLICCSVINHLDLPDVWQCEGQKSVIWPEVFILNKLWETLLNPSALIIRATFYQINLPDPLLYPSYCTVVFIVLLSSVKWVGSVLRPIQTVGTAT